MASNAPDLESLLGIPVTVTSGYRNPQHNALVGGVPHSNHLTDNARDFVPKGISMEEAAARLRKAGGFTKIINEGDHVHVSYGNQGKQVPSISDDDLMKALTGGTPSATAIAQHGNPQDISDDQLLKALTTGSDKTVPPPPPQEKTSTFADVVRAIPGGLAKGAAMVAGIPGDLNELFDTGANALMDKISPVHRSVSDVVAGRQPHWNVSSRGSLPTSGEIGEAISKPFGGFYEPKTTPGKYADTISQFAPSALAPGGLPLRIARVVAPGAASEMAGEAAAGTPYEGVARFGGALLGAGALGGAKALLAPSNAPPTAGAIKAAASAAYRRAEQAGVVVKESEIHNLGSKIAQDVENAGIDPTLHPKAVAALNRITGSNGDLSLKKIDILRRVANGAAGSIDHDESRIAHIILDHIDDFVENLGPGQTIAGNTSAASSAIKEARSLWAKQSKSSLIDGLIERAKNRAETVGGSGLENGIRVEFRQLAQNEKKMARFSADERTAIKTVARGGPLGNLARTLGKLAPTNLISILGEMGAIAHDPKALAIPVAGTLGRVAATAATKRNALLASETVRRGAPAAAAPAVTPELLTALLGRQRQESGNGNALFPPFAMAH